MFLSTFHLLVLFLLPGLCLMLSFRDQAQRVPELIAFSFGVSLAYNMVSGLLLLHFGLFSVSNLWLSMVVPIGWAAIRWRVVIQSVRSISVDTGAMLSFLALALVVLLAILTTPRWTFLISPNMDAGNYETYGNHFWKTGSLYFDISDYREREVPMKWLHSRNTWKFHKDVEIGRPNYLFGYPVLLGIAKSVYGVPTVSWIINALVAMFSAGIMALIGIRLSRSRLIGILLSVSVCATPMFFYYAKQMMSEQIGLFAVLLFMLALLEDREKKSMTTALIAACSLMLLFLVKIDAYLIIPFLWASLFFSFFEDHDLENSRLFSIAVLIAISVAIFASGSLVRWLCNPTYLDKISFKYWSTAVSQDIMRRSFFTEYFVLFGLLFSGLVLWAHALSKEKVRRIRWPKHIDVDAIVTGGLAFCWMCFIVWNLLIRPPGMDMKKNHDAFNLVRLFSVTSPAILSLFLFAVPLAILVFKGSQRVLLLTLSGTFAFLLYKSNHSPPEVWWMRRYLYVLLPGMVMALSGTYGYLAKKEWVPANKLRIAASCLLLVTLVFQHIAMKPLYKHKVNENAGAQIGELLGVIPNEALLIVTKSDSSIIRGMANTLRSLRSGPTLLNVKSEDVVLARESFQDVPALSVISHRSLDAGIVRHLDLILKKEGKFSKQWSNSLKKIRKDPAYRKTSKYRVYEASVN